jgi:hypothetical protein
VSISGSSLVGFAGRALQSKAGQILSSDPRVSVVTG